MDIRLNSISIEGYTEKCPCHKKPSQIEITSDCNGVKWSCEWRGTSFNPHGTMEPSEFEEILEDFINGIVKIQLKTDLD